VLWRHLKHKTLSRRSNCVSVYCLQLVSTFEDCGFALSNLSCSFLVVMSSSSLLLISPTTQLASEDGF
jgi:hypothetical protein